MKDAADHGTGDMFGEKKRRGRPQTGKAKTAAERQAQYRQRQREINVTVTINRGLIELLDAQMQAWRDGGSAVLLTAEQAGEILQAIRTAEQTQLPNSSVDNAPAHSPQAV